ncbi:hypothetical protein GEMRC1_005364 [Eukaryota sp. GEM-RC1]
MYLSTVSFLLCLFTLSFSSFLLKSPPTFSSFSWRVFWILALTLTTCKISLSVLSSVQLSTFDCSALLLYSLVYSGIVRFIGCISPVLWWLSLWYSCASYGYFLYFIMFSLVEKKTKKQLGLIFMACGCLNVFIISF